MDGERVAVLDTKVTALEGSQIILFKKIDKLESKVWAILLLLCSNLAVTVVGLLSK